MMERFNFYDLYGYFLPGVFWLGLLYLPFALKSGFPSSLTAAITVSGLILGYLAGLLLQTLAREFLPSTLDDRYPSDLLLDEQDETLSASLKWQIVHHIHRRFGIDVGDSMDHDRERRRNDAFHLCRTALAQGKVGSYAEQYQGMYSLMRGLATTCVLAIGFYAGWILALGFPLAGSSRGAFLGGLIVVILAVVGVLLKSRWPKKWKKLPKNIEFWLFGTMLAVFGFLAGGLHQIAATQAFVLVVAILFLLVACRRFKNASKFFMKTFAESVYRDFLALATATENQAAE